MHEITLENIGNGALKERFEDTLQMILANIQDPNTNPKAKRKIIITLEWKPDKGRSISDVSIKVESKLAAHESVETIVYMGIDGKRILATEQDLQQDGLFDH